MLVNVPRTLPAGLERRPGALPPWRDLPVAARSSISLARVRSAFRAPFVARDDPFARAAVIAPVYEEAGEAVLVLIRRAHTLRQNPGDIAFPGGHVEEGELAVEAALRESYEEIGLDPNDVEVIGDFATIERPRDSWHIAPFIGLVPTPPTLIAAPSEVDEILHLPLSAFAAEGVAMTEVWTFEGAPREVHFFRDPAHSGELVWGSTGRVIWELLTRVLT